MSDDLQIHPGLVIPGRELVWTASRSGGPGGQNVNKVATKVELRFDVAASSVLRDAVKARLLAIGASRLDASGRLIVVSDETRSQGRNLELARARLADLVRAALVAPKRRRKTRPSAASRRERIVRKRKAGEKKRDRRTRWED